MTTALLALSAHKVVPPLLLAGIIGFIVYLFRRRRRLETGVDAFRVRRGLRGLGKLTPGWHQVLGAGHWAGWSGVLATQAGPVPYHWFEGFQMVSRYMHPFVAVVLPASLVDARFLARVEQARRNVSWWREALFREPQAPLRAEPIAEDRFLLTWTVCTNPQHYEMALRWVEETINSGAASPSLAQA